MPRIALGLEYDGTDFAGWQRQPGARTVQACVEEALARVADHPVTLQCAGRTDAGVHARGQVAHFDAHSERSLRGWQLGANSNLAADVSVVWARFVPSTFHARFSARSRTYRYRILNRPARSAIERARACWVPQALDVTRMQAAAAGLVGRHDFTSFRAADCQAKTSVRTLHRLALQRHGEWIELEACADAFLHHMVRNLAGLLIHIGKGAAPPEWAAEVLAARDRRRAGPTAPAAGLFLMEVGYDVALGLPGAGDA